MTQDAAGRPAALPPPAGGPPTGAPPAPPAAGAATSPRRRHALLIVTLVLLLVAAIWVGWYLAVGRWHESTDDAYVSGDNVPLTSEIAGTVTAILADDTAQVAAGDVLVRLEDADEQVAVAQAEADLGQAVRSVRQLQAAVARAQAQRDVSAATLARARADLERRAHLEPADALSAEDLDHARLAVRQDQAQLALDEAALASAEAQVSGTTLATHPQVAVAAARLTQALIDQERTVVRAPIAGVIARRTVQVGAHIQPGQTLLSIIPTDRVWIDANFKERQLRRVHPGQRVRVHVDLYGDGVTFHGAVIGLEAGTGSAFALLPAQNASGNWIKIVQRLPVRIGLDPQELRAHPLRLGLSSQVTIDLEAASEAATSAWTGQSATQDAVAVPAASPAILARVQAIIAQHAQAVPAAPGAAEHR